MHSLTSARPSLSVDQHARQVRYLISMIIRTVCVALAVVVDGPWRWFFLVGAVFLPYVAVVLANAGRESGGPGPIAAGPAPLGALTARPVPPEDTTTPSR